MATLTAPIMTDATGQSIDSKLNSLLGKMDNLAAAFQPNASGIVYSNTTSGLIGDDVQEAIDEMAADVSEIKQSLSNLTSNDELYKTSNVGDTNEHEFSLNYSALNYLFITIEVSWLSASTFTGILTIPSAVWVKTNGTDTTRIYTNNNPNNSYIEVLMRSSDKIKVKASNANVGLRITGIGKIA